MEKIMFTGRDMMKKMCLRGLALYWLFMFMPFSYAASPQPSLLELEPLIREALVKNPELLAAKEKLQISRERIPQAGALEDPMAGFGIGNLPTSFSLREEDMTMKEISVSQKLPYPGKRSLMKEMAGKEADAVAYEVQETANRIVRQVAIAFNDLSHVYRAIDVTRRNKEILEGFARIAESRYALGEGIQQDIIKARVEIAKMVDDLIMLDQRKKALEARLNALLDRPTQSPLPPPVQVAPRKLSIAVETLQEMALEANPTLLGLRKMIEAREKAHSLARKEYYPDFNLRLAYGQRDNSPEGMTRRDLVSGMVEINLPVFYKSKQDRKVAEALAAVRAAQAEYGSMRNEIFYMVAELSAMVERVEKQLELYRTGIIPEAALQIDSALSAYRVNKADFLTLLDGRMTLFRYELEYHQALNDFEKNVASLGAITGKFLFPKEGT